MITDEEKQKVWLKYSKEDRQMMINGCFNFLVDYQDCSTEHAIQRIIDTFGCPHQEVVEALMEHSKNA